MLWFTNTACTFSVLRSTQTSPVSTHKPRETETNDPIKLRTAKLGATQEVEAGRL